MGLEEALYRLCYERTADFMFDISKKIDNSSHLSKLTDGVGL
jgi:hypothetical protein